MPIVRFIVTLFDRIFLILGVLVGAQIPLFMQQYIQRLSGHVTELNRFVSNLRLLANQSNKNLTQYIEKFQTSSDLDFSNHGIFMLEVVKRQEQMNNALQNLLNSPTWKKLYFFFQNLQYEVAQKTWESFQPGLTLTVEGLSYMALGGVISFCIYHFFIQVVIFIINFFRSSINFFNKKVLSK